MALFLIEMIVAFLQNHVFTLSVVHSIELFSMHGFAATHFFLYHSYFRECIHGAVLRTIGRRRPGVEGLGTWRLVRFKDQRPKRLYSDAMEKYGAEDA